MSTRREPKKKLKLQKIFLNTDYIINNAIYDYGDFKQWLDFEKQIFEGYGYDFEFLGIRSIQLNIEPTKASIGSYVDLPCDLKNAKINIKYTQFQIQLLTTNYYCLATSCHAPCNT